RCEPRAGLIGPEDIGQRNRVRGWRNVASRNLSYPNDCAQDDIQLTSEDIELGVGDSEPSQPGEVSNLVTGDGRHVLSFRSYGGSPANGNWHLPATWPSLCARHPDRILAGPATTRAYEEAVRACCSCSE